VKIIINMNYNMVTTPADGLNDNLKSQIITYKALTVALTNVDIL